MRLVRRWCCTASLAQGRVLTLGLTLICVAEPVFAGYGVFTHGYGIKSLGFGGMGFVFVEDSYALSANPAGAINLGNRTDFGLDFEHFGMDVTVRTATPGDPEPNVSNRSPNFFIPQAGFTRRLNDRFAYGVTGFVAGLGSDYRPSPYQRFGGSERVEMGLSQVSVAFALAYRLAPGQAIGVSLNPSYQELRVKGASAFGALSQDPEHVSDQGKDGRYGIGFTLGWLGELAPDWMGALSYRSKSWTQRYDEYRGVIPDEGKFELPAIWGGGLSWAFVPGWKLATEYQRIEYASELATGNPFTGLGGPLLGSKDGPLLGWNDQDVYKVGLAWDVNPTLTVRAGYGHGSENMPESQTLFGALAPSFLQDHYTASFTRRLNLRWELTCYAAYAMENDRRGSGSIPAEFGGGEFDLGGSQDFLGFSLGRLAAD